MNRSLLFLIISFLCLGILYALVTPPFEASDETFHYPVVRHIAQGNGLPIQKIGVKQAWEQEGSQPPLYYLMAAGITSWIDTSDYDAVSIPNPFARIGIPGTPQNANYSRYSAVIARDGFSWRGTILAVMIIRLFSLLLGAGTITFTYLLAKKIDGKQSSAMSLLAASLVGFNPMFLFISASINNDNLTWFLSATILYLVAVEMHNNASLLPKRALLLGILLGCAAISKISGLVLAPIVGLAMLIQVVRTRAWKQFFINGTIISACTIMIAGWWYVRNMILYGEPLGLNTMVAIAGPRPSGFAFLNLFSEWQSFWYSYFGVFGVFDVLASSWVYSFYAILVATAIAGLCFNLLFFVKRKETSTKPEIALHILLILFTAITFVSLIRWTMTTMASQGRLMFTTIPIISMYLATGLLAWSPVRYRKIVVSVIVGIIGSIAIFTASNSIASTYLLPAPISETELPSDLKITRAKIASGVELIGYKIDSPNRITPNDSVSVTLYWRCLESTVKDYNLFLHLLGQKRALIGNIDTWTGGGLRPTSLWRVGEIYKERYVVALDPQAQVPSKLSLDLAMWEKNSNQTLAKPITLDVGLLDSVQAISTTPQVSADSTLEGGINFIGYDLPDNLIAGKPIPLLLYWSTSAPIQNDYTVFVHVLDAQGKRVAQADAPPLNGDWLTSMWQINRVVIDPHTFTLSAGQYTIRIGLYDPKTVEPLPAFRSDGNEWNDRAIELGKITIR